MYIIFKWFALDCYNVLWIAEFTINFLHICEEPIIAKRPVFFTKLIASNNLSTNGINILRLYIVLKYNLSLL